MRKLIRNILVITFLCSSSWAYVFDADVPQTIKQQLIGDLAFVSSIHGSSATPLHQEIFGNVAGADYIKFFSSHVDTIGIGTCDDTFAVACANPPVNDKKIWLTSHFAISTLPQIARVMALFHEARHLESDYGYWPHAQCPSPFLDEKGSDILSIWTGQKIAGQDSCDRTPLGSYGASVIMLVNIARFCTNCSPQVQKDAIFYANDQAKRIITVRARQALFDDLLSP